MTMTGQPRKAIVNQLKTKGRRATDFKLRAELAEKAELSLTAELSKANVRIAELGASYKR